LEPDNGAFTDFGGQNLRFDLERRDVFAASSDRILHPVNEK
jgi:hypothetical protein